MNKDTILLFYPAPWEGEQKGRIPYSLLYLERMVRHLRLNVILIDEQVTKDYLPILNNIADRLLFAGVSVMTGYQITGGVAFSKILKGHTSCPIVWGGWHATLLPEQVLREPYVDLVITGQGEMPFEQLSRCLLTGQNYESIPGLGYKKDCTTIVNPAAAFVDINSFPKVDYSLINLNDYVFKSAYANRCLGYFTSHGCPYSCGFCCVAEVYGKKWYHKKIQDVIEDINYFKLSARIDCITFDDDNFFVNKKYTLDLCDQLIKAELSILWDTSAHAGLFNRLFKDTDIDIIYQAGCRQIYIGAESGDQAVLDSIAKHCTVDDNYKFVELMNRHSIIPLFSTMICFPQNPDRDFRMTLEMIRKSKLIDRRLRARIFFYTPYPGTELYKTALEKGFVPPVKLEDWTKHTLRRFHAPWWNRDYRWELEIFANFYLPLVNPYFYKMVPIKYRFVALIINKLFSPFVYFRFKYNIFKWPLEAICFLVALRMYNNIFKTKLSLGFESYIE